MDSTLIEGPGNHPAPALVPARDPETPITDPCGCNQPGAVHQRGDEAWCRATRRALGLP